jgi:hypothetical protein
MATELACQPADILKMVEDYLKDLGNRVVLRELSTQLEKGWAAERTALLKVIEVKTNKLRAALGKGDMAGIMEGREILSAQLAEYLRGTEADEGEGVTLDQSGKWRERPWASRETSYRRLAVTGGMWAMKKRMPLVHCGGQWGRWSAW